MDVAGISASAVAALAAQADPTSAVQMAVLKKALDLEGQSALQLLQAIAHNSYNNPANLGNSIDTFA